jgi:hypothetical protein
VPHQYNSESLAFPISVTLLDDDGGSATATATVAVTGYVTSLYQDVLLRSPDTAGLDFWNGLLRGGATRAQVASAFWLSAEHRGLQVDFFYAEILHRQADPGGRAFWVNALVAGASEADVVLSFVTSGEYAASHVSNRDYVEGIYRDLLERSTTSASEVDFWQVVLDTNTRTRAQVAFNFLSSDEAYLRAIDDNYRGFLGRAPSASEVQFWQAQLEGGFQSPVSFATGFLASDEYFARATS